MKKYLISLLLAIGFSAFAHDMFTYTNTLKLDDADAVKGLILFGHPENFDNFYELSIDTVPQKAFVFHQGEKKDILGKLKKVDIKFPAKTVSQFEYEYTKADGLVGNGHWIFFVDCGLGQYMEKKYAYYTKLIINKGGRSVEWGERVADGYPEIVAYTDPTTAWTENGFTGKFVDSKGNGVPNIVLHASYINSKIENNSYVPSTATDKTSISIKTDDHGMFHFNPSRPGLWIVGGSVTEDNIMKRPNLIIEFK